GRGEAGYRVAQPIAEGFQFLGEGAHRGAEPSRRRSSMPRYKADSGSSSATATHSLSLWIVALTGPSSMISRQTAVMKRPSDVPPLQETSGTMPQTSPI